MRSRFAQEGETSQGSALRHSISNQEKTTWKLTQSRRAVLENQGFEENAERLEHDGDLNPNSSQTLTKDGDAVQLEHGEESVVTVDHS